MSIDFDEEDRRWSLEWLSRELQPTPEQIDELARLLDNLGSEAERQNLVAKGTLPFSWSRHVVDSAQLLTHVPRETSRTWLDMGTGAGFPGLVCALLRPDIQFTLVEQRPLRTEWLSRMVTIFGMGNATVLTQNVSALRNQKFDVVSARAFAPLPRLLDLSAAFSTKATAWVLPKGRSAKQELEELKGWDHMFHVEQSVTDPQSGIIIGNLLGRR